MLGIPLEYPPRFYIVTDARNPDSLKAFYRRLKSQDAAVQKRARKILGSFSDKNVAKLLNFYTQDYDKFGEIRNKYINSHIPINVILYRYQNTNFIEEIKFYQDKFK